LQKPGHNTDWSDKKKNITQQEDTRFKRKRYGEEEET
jgi:hypothetical protein